MYLKTAIRGEAGLDASLDVAKNFPNLNESFDAFSNHLTSSITNRRSRSEMTRNMNPRVVAGNETFESSRNTSRGRGRGFRGGGRFRGNGRGRGRGGRKPTYNSVHYNNDKVPETITVEGKILFPRRIYQKTEYNRLTPTQKSELYKARSNNSAINTSNDDLSTIDSRQISSTMTEIRDLLKTQSCKNESGDSSKSGENESVTSQFRKRRHNQN